MKSIYCILILVLVIIIATFITLFFKRRNYLYKININRKLKALITTGLLENTDNEMSVAKIHAFSKSLERPLYAQYTIDELIDIKTSILGGAVKNIPWLYEELGLKKISLAKLSSTEWFIKARGIQELYLMEQSDTLKKIYKNVNDKNDFIRMEAQVGMINLTGFEGLRFLNVINYVLTEWQQIRLLERLRTFEMNQAFLEENIPKWLGSDNYSVVIFALKLAEDYQQYGLHDEVVRCLDHENEKVRLQAIRTLHSIPEESTPNILTEYYTDETYLNKLCILDSLANIANQNQVSFLAGILQDPSDTIKLKAAKVLGRCSVEGMNLLAKIGQLEPEPYQRIYLHVKSEDH